MIMYIIMSGGTMPKCVPIKDLRDTARFSELVATASGPITVTRNGRDEFVVMRSDDYDDLLEELAKAKLMERMLVAEHERKSGEALDAAETLRQIRERHGV
jgi:prevent-host-death family protein